ncbi:unnamed protein product, partial [Allacma fusca]
SISGGFTASKIIYYYLGPGPWSDWVEWT